MVAVDTLITTVLIHRAPRTAPILVQVELRVAKEGEEEVVVLVAVYLMMSARQVTDIERPTLLPQDIFGSPSSCTAPLDTTTS